MNKEVTRMCISMFNWKQPEPLKASINKVSTNLFVKMILKKLHTIFFTRKWKTTLKSYSIFAQKDENHQKKLNHDWKLFQSFF